MRKLNILNRCGVSAKLSKQQLNKAVKVMQIYLGSLDKTRLVDQQRLYTKVSNLIKSLAINLGMDFNDVWDQIEKEASKRGKITPIPGQHI